jgi:hypothetical protein
MVSKSWDDTIRLWRTDIWDCLAILDESTSMGGTPPPAFHPTGPVLATVGEEDLVIRIWRLDYQVLQGDSPFLS